MPPKAAASGIAPALRGGRGVRGILGDVVAMRRRGFDDEHVRRDLKARGYKPSRIAQLLQAARAELAAAAPPAPAAAAAEALAPEPPPAGAPQKPGSPQAPPPEEAGPAAKRRRAPVVEAAAEGSASASGGAPPLVGPLAREDEERARAEGNSERNRDRSHM